ncbi:MAG: adenylate/guanylate cyclase domain-containing protein [Actinomycetota bacterium]
MLFTDMVDSTAVAEEMGDRRWKTLTKRHHGIVRRELKRFGGREIDTAGDGFFATFREPAAAIACASAASEAVRELGVEIRAGVHFGECEQIGKNLSGITVVVGARIMALGGGGDVLVSGTVAELTRGAGYGMSDRGTHTLKGVGGEWKVFAIDAVDGAPRSGPLDPTEAAERRASIAHEEDGRRVGTPLLIGGLAVAVVAAVGLIFAFSRSSEATVPQPDTIARIDPDGGSFGSTVKMGARAFPEAITVGGGNVWVANVSNRTLMQVDPEDGSSQVFGTSSAPTGVAFADGRVWVTYGFTSDPSRGMDVLDPVDHVMGPAQISVPNASAPIAAGDDVLWIGDPLGSTVLRYDPESGGTTTVALPDGSGVASLGVSDESVWVAAGRQPSVFRIDATDPSQPVERFGTGGDLPTALSVAPDGTVWIVERDADSVLSLSSTGSTRVDVALGDRCDAPSAVAATDAAVWISCATSSNVIQLDPRDGSVVASLDVDGDPGPLADDDSGGVWVAVRGDV